MSDIITTKETTTLEEGGSVPVLSDFDYAKNLMQSLDNIINNAPNSSAEEFNDFIRTLENSLATNKIKWIENSVADVLSKIKCLRNYEVTREDLMKAFYILRAALTKWINEEENRKLDIEAIRRVGQMFSKNPEAFYNAIFLKRE